MGRSTGPAIAVSLRYQSRTDRIALDIANSIPKMGVIQNAGVEATLPEMTLEAIFSVEIIGVTTVEVVKTT
jgi:hypothetical protein